MGRIQDTLRSVRWFKEDVQDSISTAGYRVRRALSPRRLRQRLAQQATDQIRASYARERARIDFFTRNPDLDPQRAVDTQPLVKGDK